MTKIIVKTADRHNKNNQELMKIRQHFLEKIEALGGLDMCRENTALIQELETTEKNYDARHESVIERFLYGGTVHWVIREYDETVETFSIYKLSDGTEIFKKYSRKDV